MYRFDANHYPAFVLFPPITEDAPLHDYDTGEYAHVVSSQCSVLYYTLLYCTVPYCAVLYCAVLCCDVLYCIVLYYTVLITQ